MHLSNESQASREARLDAIIAEFLQMQDRGYQVNKQAFIAKHPDLATELEEFLQGIPALDSVADFINADADTSEREDTSDTRYSVSSLHASGGIGRIYVAQDGDLRRKVALKSIHPRLHSHPVVQARFLREAQITGQLEHPNIVPVYELVRSHDGAVRFYTMRLVRGKTLRAEIREYYEASPHSDQLAFRRLISAFLSVCYAVDYAHSRSIIHRDLKPDNVMIGKFGEVALMDWGLAKHVTSEDAQSSAVQLSAITSPDVSTPNFEPGTPAYMAPEQAKAESYLVGCGTDVYGLGAILFELLTGEVPHIPRNGATLRDQIANGPSPDPVARRSDSPLALAAICRNAMAFCPRDRYSSAKALADDIERWLADEPVSVHRDPLLKRATRWVRRHRVAASLLSGIAAAACIAAVGWWTIEEANDRRALADTSRLLGAADAAFSAGEIEEAARGYSNAQIRADGRRRLHDLHARATEQLTVVEATLRDRSDFEEFGRFVNERLTAAEADMMLGDNEAASKLCQQILRRFDTEGWQPRLTRSNLDSQAVLALRQNLTAAILLLVATKRADHDDSDPKHEEILALLSRGSSIYPASRGVWLLKAEYLQALDRWDIAAEALKTASEIPSRTAFDFFVQGDIERQKRHLQKAIEQYERALQLAPVDFWSHIRLSSCWLQLNRPQRALAHLDHAMRVRPDAPWLHAARAIIHAELRSWSEASADLAAADKIDPDFYGTSNNRGIIYVRKALNATGPSKEPLTLLRSAEAEFHRCLQQRPSYAGAWNNIGRVHQELGRLATEESKPGLADQHFEMAVSAFTSALEIDPRQTIAITNRGLTKASLRDFDGALVDIEQAKRLEPSEPGVYLALGQVALTQGEVEFDAGSTGNAESFYRAAEKHFARAIELSPHEAAGYLNRAIARFEILQVAVNKHVPGARKIAESTLVDLERAEDYAAQQLTAQQYAQLLGMRATARVHLGDYDTALADYALSLKIEPDNAYRRVRRGWALIMAANVGMSDFEQVLNTDHLDNVTLRADALAGRAYLLALAGDDSTAAAAAEQAVSLAPDHWPTLFNAACVFSLASGVARQERRNEELADQYASRAIELLRQSIRIGLNDRHSKLKDRAFVPILRHPDFQSLLEDPVPMASDVDNATADQ